MYIRFTRGFTQKAPEAAACRGCRVRRNVRQARHKPDMDGPAIVWPNCSVRCSLVHVFTILHPRHVWLVQASSKPATTQLDQHCNDLALNTIEAPPVVFCSQSRVDIDFRQRSLTMNYKTTDIAASDWSSII